MRYRALKLILNTLVLCALVPTELYALHRTGLVSWDPAQGRMWDAQCQNHLALLGVALKQYHREHGCYPVTLEELECRKAIPTCPGLVYASVTRRYRLVCYSEHWAANEPHFSAPLGFHER